MNTPTHMILNYALLSDATASKKDKWAAVLGGFIPDIAIFVLFFYALICGIPQQIVWREMYFSDGWQLAINLLHSFPIFIALALVGWVIKKRWLIIFSVSMCLHSVLDFFTHVHDAHAHFVPFSDFKYQSILSYWNRRYFAEVGEVIELGLIVISIMYLWSRLETRWTKILIAGYTLLSIVMMFAGNFLFG